MYQSNPVCSDYQIRHFTLAAIISLWTCRVRFGFGSSLEPGLRVGCLFRVRRGVGGERRPRARHAGAEGPRRADGGVRLQGERVAHPRHLLLRGGDRRPAAARLPLAAPLAAQGDVCRVSGCRGRQDSHHRKSHFFVLYLTEIL